MTINLDERVKSEDAMGVHSLVNNIGLPDAEAFWKHRERDLPYEKTTMQKLQYQEIDLKSKPHYCLFYVLQFSFKF